MSTNTDEFILESAKRSLQVVKDLLVEEPVNIDEDLEFIFLSIEIAKGLALCELGQNESPVSPHIKKKLLTIQRNLNEILSEQERMNSIRLAKKNGERDCLERIANRKKVKVKVVCIERHMYTDEDIAYIDGWNAKLNEIDYQKKESTDVKSYAQC